MISDLLTNTELLTLKELIDRYFEIKEYGWHVWGRRFYERLYIIKQKIDDALANVTELGPYKDDFTYIELKILLNMVRSEGMGWLINEAPNYWHLRVSQEPIIFENPRELVFGIIMVKLRKRIERQN